MNDLQRSFLSHASAEAAAASHPFPEMAACEAAEESSYGNSQLAREAFNLFGTKQHAHPIYGTLNLPTREWEKSSDGSHGVDGRWITVIASWVKYQNLAECFADRKATLERLSNAYPHYAAALRAHTPEEYIAEVSKSWSTDPNRAGKILSIYQEWKQ